MRSRNSWRRKRQEEIKSIKKEAREFRVSQYFTLGCILKAKGQDLNDCIPREGYPDGKER